MKEKFFLFARGSRPRTPRPEPPKEWVDLDQSMLNASIVYSAPFKSLSEGNIQLFINNGKLVKINHKWYRSKCIRVWGVIPPENERGR